MGQTICRKIFIAYFGIKTSHYSKIGIDKRYNLKLRLWLKEVDENVLRLWV